MRSHYIWFSTRKRRWFISAHSWCVSPLRRLVVTVNIGGDQENDTAAWNLHLLESCQLLQMFSDDLKKLESKRFRSNGSATLRIYFSFSFPYQQLLIVLFEDLVTDAKALPILVIEDSAICPSFLLSCSKSCLRCKPLPVEKFISGLQTGCFYHLMVCSIMEADRHSTCIQTHMLTFRKQFL